MSKDNKSKIRDFFVNNSKFIFPVVVVIVAAVTVSFALNANRKKAEEESAPSSEESIAPVALEESGEQQPEEPDVPKEVPLMPNEDEAIQTLVTTYYDTMASGDSAAMAALYDELTESEQLRCEETAQYVDHITVLEIYTKEGPEAGSRVVYVYYKLCFLNHEDEVPGFYTFYVCDDGQGNLYIKNEKNFSEEEEKYVVDVSDQADVVEFYNRVTVEYNDLMRAAPQLLTYQEELRKQVNAAVGVRLAEQNADGEPAEGEGAAPVEGEAPGNGTDPAAGAAEDPGTAAPAGPTSAVATTTVNVRSSDSELADRLGQVVGGTKVQVQEVRANGWTKIVYDGGDGYIKSEYLQLEESAEGQEVIGTVTANTNVNVRAAASETAELVGILVGGDTAELLANENGWCKIKYDGKVAYVKGEYVTQ